MITRVTSSLSGPLVAMLAAALFGASTPLAKMLLGDGMDPWLSAGLAVVFLFRRQNAGEQRLQRADWGWRALIVLTGGIAAPLLLMVGLLHTSASSASLLLNLEGLATMAIAWVVFKEYVDRRLLLGAFAILAGALQRLLSAPFWLLGCWAIRTARRSRWQRLSWRSVSTCMLPSTMNTNTITTCLCACPFPAGSQPPSLPRCRPPPLTLEHSRRLPRQTYQDTRKCLPQRRAGLRLG